MERLIGMDESFDGKSHPSIQEYIRSGMENNELQEAVVGFDMKVAKLIQEQKYLQGFISEERDADQVKMKFMVGCLDYFGRWLLTYTDAVTVESPVALRNIMKGLAGKIYIRYLAKD
jgi:hypothetical protein